MIEANEFERWVESVRALLAELSTQDFGYPIGVNEARDRAIQRHDLPAQLRPLYAVCDGVSMPDVHVGYFIDSAASAAFAVKRGDPTQIRGTDTVEIDVFGSDGGGGRFALDRASGAVYYLPSAGEVRAGVYIEDDVASRVKIAERLIDFLWLLQKDLQAFVDGRTDHTYLTQQGRR